MAFGTGTHETLPFAWPIEDEKTLVVKSFRYRLRLRHSFILAKKLGASQVQACDIDPIAVASAKDNAQINGVDVSL